MTAAFRLLLLPAYLVLAHLAEARESPTLAVIALVDVALLVLVEGLVALRPAAWLGALAAALALAWLAHGTFALTSLLLVPPAFTALVGTWFLRSLRPGRVPLIRKVVAAFGANRCMWESDCPFQIVDHEYLNSFNLVRKRLDFLSADDKEWLLRKTAEEFFFKA